MNDGSSKKLGVIGGMGPAATLLFYDMMIRHTAADSDQAHIDMIIISHASMPDRTKSLKEGRRDELLSKLSEDARLLETCGADAVLITCNTSYVLADEIQAAIGVPLLSMIKEAVRECAGSVGADVSGGRLGFPDEDADIGGRADLSDGRRGKTAILATDGTIESGLYQRELASLGMTGYIPSPESQKLIMKLIYEGVKGGGEPNIDDFSQVENELIAAGCERAILACTELSVLKERWQLPEFYLDAMLSLVKRAIKFAEREYKNV
ncbi:MAG: amino acid racemase [Clostridiales Family XIII bacterium]|jgi:aspartate racemase|nr:amino acid racemase [Clostridiales Family XIII bacterium]